MRQLAALMPIALLVFAATDGVSRAGECFGGVSCTTAALAASSFMLANECPSVFIIDPSRAGEFRKVMSALRRRPMAGVFDDHYPKPERLRPMDECNRAGKAVVEGKVPGLYIVVRPDVARSLEQ